jgi:hypothetical protein
MAQFVIAMQCQNIDNSRRRDKKCPMLRHWPSACGWEKGVMVLVCECISVVAQLDIALHNWIICYGRARIIHIFCITAHADEILLTTLNGE